MISIYNVHVNKLLKLVIIDSLPMLLIPVATHSEYGYTAKRSDFSSMPSSAVLRK